MADRIYDLIRETALGPRGSRGIPGYPVPPEMKAPRPVDEADDKELPKSIQHLEDLKPDQFMSWLRKYRDLPLHGKLEVSEKVDGSARITFGVENGKIWTKSKNGPKKHSSSEYPDKPMFRALRAAHHALEHRASEVIPVLQGSPPLVAEVLYTRIPNSIEYGPNAIIIHGGDKMVAERLIKSLGGKIVDGKDEWNIEYKRTIDPKDVMVDVEEEFSSLEEIYRSLKKTRTKGGEKSHLERFHAIQLALKEKLVKMLRQHRSAYSSEDGDMEGIVFQDLESGELTKLVDREYFSALNKFLWRYRELLSRGVKVGDDWRPGVAATLGKLVADDVMGAPVIKTGQFIPFLHRRYADIDYPVEADTEEKKVDYVLSRYIADEHLMKGEFLTRFDAALVKTGEEFSKVQQEWETAREGEIEFVSPDGRRRKMDQIIKDRTDEAFEEMARTLMGIAAARKKLGKIKDEQTRRVALLKIFMGPERLEKMKSKLPGKTDESRKIVEARFDSKKNVRKLNGDEAAELAQVAGNSATRLRKRGIELAGARPLGVGSNGVAFQLHDGRVLKVTEDASEANASHVVKGKSYPNVVKVFDVFMFPPAGNLKLFGILQEKLEPISKQDQNEFTTTIVDCEIDSGFMSAKLWQSGKTWEEIVGNAIESMEADDDSTPQDVEKLKKNLALLKDKYQMDKMTDQLMQARIKFSDWHGGNIMKRGNEHVVIDLGVSKSPKQKIDVLESIVRMISEEIPSIPAAAKNQKVSADQAQRLLKGNADKLAKRGIDVKNVGQVLGVGSRGTAFEIGDGKVLKITNDKTEAVASNKLKDMKLKHVVQIFDVFRFPTSANIYGILQEQLTPIPGTGNDPDHVTGEAAELNSALIFTMFPKWVHKANGDPAQAYELTKDYVKNAKTGKIATKDAMAILKKGNEAWRTILKFKIPDMMTELKKAGIMFQDYHAGNIMMRRNGEYVLIDIGHSKVDGGKEPDVLEAVIRGVIKEGKADTIGVTIGRYQPFHKGHAEIIRNLARRFTKVIVIVAGNKLEAKNPFSFETRKDLMRLSLPDVESKLEIYKAEIDGKPSGFVPGILNRVVTEFRSSVEHDVAINVLVGQDRLQDVQKMFERAIQYKKDGNEMYFDPALAIVEALPDVKNDDDAGRVSGTRVRASIIKDDKKAVLSMLDPHVASDRKAFDDVYEKMKTEIGKFTRVGESLDEDLVDVGGQAGMEKILGANAQVIARARQIDVTKARPLGHGQMGVAFDIGQNRVLKLTTDKDEARTSNHIKGKNKEHVVHIHDVFGLKSTEGKNPVYCVVTEKLTELSHEEAQQFDDLAHYLRDDSIIMMVATGDYPHIVEAIKQLITKHTEQELNSGPASKRSKLQVIVNQRFGEAQAALTKFQFQNIIQDLRALNIQFADYKSANLLKRGATYVVNDLGQSKSPGIDPPMIERISQHVVSSVVEGGGYGVNTSGFGAAHTGVKAGSSGFSSSRNTTDVADTPVTGSDWRDMIPDPNLKMRG